MFLNLHWTGPRLISEYPCHSTVLEHAVQRLIVEALVVGTIESLDNVSVGDSERSKFPGLRMRSMKNYLVSFSLSLLGPSPRRQRNSWSM